MHTFTEHTIDFYANLLGIVLEIKAVYRFYIMTSYVTGVEGSIISEFGWAEGYKCPVSIKRDWLLYSIVATSALVVFNTSWWAQ